MRIRSPRLRRTSAIKSAVTPVKKKSCRPSGWRLVREAMKQLASRKSSAPGSVSLLCFWDLFSDARHWLRDAKAGSGARRTRPDACEADSPTVGRAHGDELGCQIHPAIKYSPIAVSDEYGSPLSLGLHRSHLCIVWATGRNFR